MTDETPAVTLPTSSLSSLRPPTPILLSSTQPALTSQTASSSSSSSSSSAAPPANHPNPNPQQSTADAFLASMALDGTGTHSLNPASPPTSNSGSDASASSKRPADPSEGKEVHELPSPPKKVKPTDPVEPIYCLSCAQKLHPAHDTCHSCGRDPRVMPQFSGSLNQAPFANSLLSPIPACPTSLTSASTPAPTPAATGVAGLATQAWLTQGTYLPIPAEAVEALRKGEYKEISHYFPKRSSVYDADNSKGSLQLNVDTAGLMTFKPHTNTRRVSSYADLETAHQHGLSPLLLHFGDNARFAQYAMLWSIVRDMHANGTPFQIILQHYESTRMKHAGVNDKVGEFDQTIQAQTQMRLSALLLSSNSNAAVGRSSNSAFRASSSSSSSSSSGAVTVREKVCMPFNDLKCTSASCALPHKCCRCFQDHASMSGECSMPDPRDSSSAGSGPRGRRGGAGKSKSSGSGRKPGQSSSANP